MSTGNRPTGLPGFIARQSHPLRVVLPCAAFAVACLGLVAAGQLAGAPRLLAVAGLYAVTVIASFMVRPWPKGVALSLGITVGVAVLGLVTYAVALAPSLALWAWAVHAQGADRSRAATVVEVFIGFSIGLWVLLVPVFVARGN